MLDLLRESFTDNWIAWAYQYGLGGLFFFATLAVGIRAGSIDPRRRGGRRFVLVLVGGLFLWAGAHAAWITAVQGPPGTLSQAEWEASTRTGAAPGRASSALRASTMAGLRAEARE
jgi:hypothetical protein